jgi:hypothetical protein
MSNAEWITDRLPTEADGDMDGDVLMRRRPAFSEYNYAHWSHIGLGAPWQRTDYWEPPTEPTPTEPTPAEPELFIPSARIEELRIPFGGARRVVQMVLAPSASNAFFVALCNDGSLWQLDEGNWKELPAIPQP